MKCAWFYDSQVLSNDSNGLSIQIEHKYSPEDQQKQGACVRAFMTIDEHKPFIEIKI